MRSLQELFPGAQNRVTPPARDPSSALFCPSALTRGSPITILCASSRPQGRNHQPSRGDRSMKGGVARQPPLAHAYPQMGH